MTPALRLPALAALAAPALLAACGQGGATGAPGAAASGRATVGAGSARTVGTTAALTAPLAAPDDHADDAGGATPLPVDEAGVGVLEEQGDADWFVVQLTPGVRYEAALASPGTARVAVFSPGGTELASNRAAPERAVTWQASSPGRCLVRVEPVAGPVDYALTVTPRSTS